MGGEVVRLLSLFDGIGGARTACQTAGIPIEEYYSCEVSHFPEAVARYHFPEMVSLGDVEKVDFSRFHGIDLLVAGPPCQSFSIAGNRKGLDDPRGKLMEKTIEIIHRVKPRYFLIENVASMKKEIQDWILEMLPAGTRKARIDANLFTAQNRDRIYFTNFPLSPCFPIFLPPAPLFRDIIEGESMDGVPKKANTVCAIYADGAGRNVDRPGSIVPVAVPEKSGAVISRYHAFSESFLLETRGKGALVPLPEKARTATTNYRKMTEKFLMEKKRTRILVPLPEKTYTVTVSYRGGLGLDPAKHGRTVVPEVGGYRKLSNIELERLQGMPDDYTRYGLYLKKGVQEVREMSNSRRTQMIGNSFAFPVVAWILGHIPPDGKKSGG